MAPVRGGEATQHVGAALRHHAARARVGGRGALQHGPLLGAAQLAGVRGGEAVEGGVPRLSAGGVEQHARGSGALAGMGGGGAVEGGAAGLDPSACRAEEGRPGLMAQVDSAPDEPDVQLPCGSHSAQPLT